MILHKTKTQASALAKNEIIIDYKLAYMSRQAALLGRKEVLSGKAKFGIFGDGKELAQIAMAKVFQKGDWRSGYYRDQTFMLALEQTTVRQFFSQLYADTDLAHEPNSGGRQMNCHYATRFITPTGKQLDQTKAYNSSSDISSTGGQMSRLLGLAYASKLYQQDKNLQSQRGSSLFSKKGNEVAFGTIGNASTSEGVFWETINAAGVLQVPMALSIWDDDYGISVPSKYQTTKESIFEILQGFQWNKKQGGIDLYQVKGYDYEDLIATYKTAIAKCRKYHVPCIIHVSHMTQPQGHSTSGSHERYKSTARLKYEEEIDCIRMLRQHLIKHKIATASNLDKIEEELTTLVYQERDRAFAEYQRPIEEERNQALEIIAEIAPKKITPELKQARVLTRKIVHSTLRRVLFSLKDSKNKDVTKLVKFLNEYKKENEERYSSDLYTNKHSPLQVAPIHPTYKTASKKVDGRQIIQGYFDHALAKDPRLFIIGEDIGKLGGVNLEFEGLNGKHGELRVTDTGIRELTILGQGIGAALRGLRPVVDIQYLDYLIYCLQGLTDDLATLHYRTRGGQVAPVIVRTKGHRLEGIWHTGSPISMLLGSLRGMHLCVPRNCVQAAGMYQTLLGGNDPGLVIEVLNGYRVKEIIPENLGTYRVALGICDVLQKGTDITIVTYGANVRIAQEALKELAKVGIQGELIDVQTLLPFDLNNTIGKSIAKTNAVIFFDEDVPGGGTAYMMQQVLEKQNAYDFLDAKPRTLCAKDHRSAYASDGDYYSKPNAEDLIELAYNVMHERNPHAFPGQ